MDFDFTYWKRCNLLALTSRYGKFNHEIMYETLSELASFRKRYDKNVLMRFRFTLLTVVHLENANAKFHKVG